MRKKVFGVTFEYRKKELLDLIDDAKATVEIAKDCFEIQAKTNDIPEKLLLEFLKNHEKFYKEVGELQDSILLREENVIDTITNIFSNIN